jgi:hypothetical protein
VVCAVGFTLAPVPFLWRLAGSLMLGALPPALARLGWDVTLCATVSGRHRRIADRSFPQRRRA